MTSTDWYARPVLFVADIERSLAFYADKLGFTEDWRYDEDGRRLIVQVSRQGCELILSAQWPDKAGGGVTFLSLDQPHLDKVRAELEGRGVKVEDGQWGYRLMVVADPDGNALWFAYSAGETAA